MTKLLTIMAVLTAVATPALAQSYGNQPASTQAANTVYGDDGQVIGADPDLNIRMQLLRDHDGIR